MPSTRRESSSPMTRYRQPPPPRRSAWAVAARVLGWFVLGVLVLAVGLAGGVYLWVHESVAATAPTTPDAIRASKHLDVLLPGRPATALVVGYDHRLGEESGLPSRSDTLMLIRADPRTKTLSLMSFPRDLVVSIHCPGKPVYTDRINGAYAECGSRGSLETVRAPHAHPDQLPGDGQLPRLPAGRRPARRRLDRRRPPATSTSTGTRSRPTTRTSTCTPATRS